MHRLSVGSVSSIAEQNEIGWCLTYVRGSDRSNSGCGRRHQANSGDHRQDWFAQHSFSAHLVIRLIHPQFVSIPMEGFGPALRGSLPGRSLRASEVKWILPQSASRETRVRTWSPPFSEQASIQHQEHRPSGFRSTDRVSGYRTPRVARRIRSPSADITALGAAVPNQLGGHAVNDTRPPVVAERGRSQSHLSRNRTAAPTRRQKMLYFPSRLRVDRVSPLPQDRTE